MRHGKYQPKTEKKLKMLNTNTDPKYRRNCCGLKDDNAQQFTSADGINSDDQSYNKGLLPEETEMLLSEKHRNMKLA